MNWKVIKPPAMSAASANTLRLLDAKMIGGEGGKFELDITNTDCTLTLNEQKMTQKWPTNTVLSVKRAMAEGLTLDIMAARYRHNGRGWSRRTLADIRAALSQAQNVKKVSKK